MDQQTPQHEGAGEAAPLHIPDAHLAHLQAVLHEELQGLSSHSKQLQLARSLQQEQQQKQQCQQKPLAVPLLGTCLQQLVAQDQAAPVQEGGVLACMLQCSAFTQALHAELQALRGACRSSYGSVKQQLAAVGAHLPPAAQDNNDAAAHASTSFYGEGLDLAQLQLQADDASLKLIHLEDSITSTSASLATLAQQYDVAVTGALAASEAEQPAVPASPTAAAGASGEAQYAFLTPGVCSHSNPAKTHKYTAGWLLPAWHAAGLKALNVRA